MPRKPGRMAKLGKKTMDQTNRELEDLELNVLLQTTIDWEDLRPQLGNQNHYDELIEIVKTATRKNENIAQLKNRLESLGKEGWNLARKVINIVT